MSSDGLQKELLELYLRMLRMNRFFGRHLVSNPESDCLTPAQTHALLALFHSETQNMSQLAQTLVVQPQQLTHTVDLLVRRGLACRKENPANRRAVLVSLTEQGQRVARQLGAAVCGIIPQRSAGELQQAISTVNNLMAKNAID